MKNLSPEQEAALEEYAKIKWPDLHAELQSLRERLAEAERHVTEYAKALDNNWITHQRVINAEKRSTTAEATLRTCCENEEAARAIAAKVLGDKAQGNSYCVPSVQDLMEMVVGRVGELENWLATCYRLTGADTDGNEDWRLAPDAVEEVRRLRKEADRSDADLIAAMCFVPRPEIMSGYDDQDAPYEQREMIELAKRLHGTATGGTANARVTELEQRLAAIGEMVGQYNGRLPVSVSRDIRALATGETNAKLFIRHSNGRWNVTDGHRYLDRDGKWQMSNWPLGEFGWATREEAEQAAKEVRNGETNAKG